MIKDKDANAVAACVIKQFSKLPKKGKPQVKSNGIHEWAILAGVVMEAADGVLSCVSLATGMRATPDSIVAKGQGNILHDMHAEILALRGFNRWLVEETRNPNSAILRPSEAENASGHGPPFTVENGIRWHLYISEAPCGDSSMALMRERAEAACGDLPWTDIQTISNESSTIRGRANFSALGIVRTKPGRKDSPITLSKSCSDKLALKQFVSMVSGPVSNLVDTRNLYLTSIIVPDHQFVEEDFERAFRGRLMHKATHPFEFWTCSQEPEFARSKLPENAKPCPTSIVWVAGLGGEALVKGVRMGGLPSAKTCSIVSRRAIARCLLGHAELKEYQTYLALKKNLQRNEQKQNVYTLLGSWIHTATDDFHID